MQHRKRNGLNFKVPLTVNCQSDGFPGLRVQVGVLSHTGVATSVQTENLCDDELRSRVHFRVIVEPDVLTGWIGLDSACQ